MIEVKQNDFSGKCNLYFSSDNTICDKPKGHDNNIHEPEILCKVKE